MTDDDDLVLEVMDETEAEWRAEQERQPKPVDQVKHRQNVEAYHRRKARNLIETYTLFDGPQKGDLPGRASKRGTGGRPK